MRRRIGYLLMPGALLAAALLLMAGCLAPGGEHPPNGGTGASALEGTAWDLVSLQGVNGAMTTVIPGTKVTAVFSDGGKLGGSAGCNHYFGSYTVSGGSLTVGQLGSTLMACMENGVMEQESRYLSLLGSAARFRTEGDSMTISDTSGTTILVFRKEVPPAPLPLMGTGWTLDSISTGTGAVSSVIAGTEIDALFSPDGKITGSAGCNRYFADYSTSGSSMSIGQVGSTKMFCGEPPGRMEQEQRYLSLLGSVAAYRISGDRLVLMDSRGSDILFFRVA